MADQPKLDLSDLPPDDRKSLFRMQHRLQVWKWAIGTVALTLVTTIASWHFQNREVRLEELRFSHERQLQRLEFEQKYLGEFLEFALVEDIDSRLRFAHYFASVSTNRELQKKWEEYHAELVASVPGDDEENTNSKAIGGVDALTGRQITRIWLGAEAAATMADFRDYHVKKLGWSDIGFHYYIDVDGSVKLGRPIGRTPAFVKSHNTNAIAVGIACDGWDIPDVEPPEGFTCALTPLQTEALQAHVSKLMEDHGLEVSVIGKRSDYRPVPDLLGTLVTDLQDTLLGPRPRFLP